MNNPLKKINPSFFLGLNYWASDNATHMWEDFHPEVIQEDFRRIREAGITHLRVFPLWPVFQPLRLMYTRHNAPMDYSFTTRLCPTRPRVRRESARWHANGSSSSVSLPPTAA